MARQERLAQFTLRRVATKLGWVDRRGGRSRHRCVAQVPQGTPRIRRLFRTCLPASLHERNSEAHREIIGCVVRRRYQAFPGHVKKRFRLRHPVGNTESDYQFGVLTNVESHARLVTEFQQWCANPIPIATQRRPHLCGKVRGRVRSCNGGASITRGFLSLRYKSGAFGFYSAFFMNAQRGSSVV
jgi:hypothetical protein